MGSEMCIRDSNYSTGVVTLNPVNILGAKEKDGRPILEIEATPQSNDVIGLQDLYLQLDISGSNFETVVDEIASGLDPSASNYVVSSSYSNGNLIRSGGSTITSNTASGASTPTTTITSTASSGTPSSTSYTPPTSTSSGTSSGTSSSGSSSY